MLQSVTDRDLLDEHGHVLTAKEREVVDLYARGLSQRTIALALGISRSSVRSRFESARAKFIKALEEEEAE